MRETFFLLNLKTHNTTSGFSQSHAPLTLFKRVVSGDGCSRASYSMTGVSLV